MNRLRSRVLALTLMTFASFSMAAPASADVLVTPFTGITFGGDAAKRPTVGLGVTFAGRALGLELEGSRTTDILGAKTPSANVTLLTAAVMSDVDLPGPLMKPFVLAGVGLLRSGLRPAVGSKESESNLALLLGAGLNALVSDNVGVRADIRYYRRIERSGGALPLANNLDFFRATVGLVVRF